MRGFMGDMKKCNCGCTQSQKELFCNTCFHNFDSNESFYQVFEGYLCPICHPNEKMDPNDDINKHIVRMELPDDDRKDYQMTCLETFKFLERIKLCNCKLCTRRINKYIVRYHL